MNLTPSDIEKIKNHTPQLIGLDQTSKYAVVICLVEGEVIFEVRSSKIADQPGDICLPGGKVESGEAPEEAAVRELCEELLISPDQVELIGRGDYLHSENMIVYPYVGILKDYRGTFSTDEVSKIFKVPLGFFKENQPERHKVRSVVQPGEDFPYERIQGGKNYKWRDRTTQQLFYEYEGVTIWGLTAKIMNAFAKELA